MITEAPAASKRRHVDLTDKELNDMSDALCRIRDLSHAARVILGFAPEMVALEGKPAHDGLWGILACVERLADAIARPVERNL